MIVIVVVYGFGHEIDYEADCKLFHFVKGQAHLFSPQKIHGCIYFAVRGPFGFFAFDSVLTFLR